MGIPISAMIIRDGNTPLRLVHKVGIHYMYRKPVNLMLIIKIYWLYPVFLLYSPSVNKQLWYHNSVRMCILKIKLLKCNSGQNLKTHFSDQVKAGLPVLITVTIPSIKTQKKLSIVYHLYWLFININLSNCYM